MSFFDANRRLSARLDRRWPRVPPDRPRKRNAFLARIADLTPENALVTDVGAGRRSSFVRVLQGRGCRILGVDLLGDDLGVNPDLDVRVVADIVANGLPPEAEGSSLVCSLFVLEHMPDIDRLASEAYRVLAPGGYTVHRFAGRWSAFAVANRLLPPPIARRVLFSLNPDAMERGGFVAYYDRTDPRSARRVFERAGFVGVETATSWEMADYFRMFFPAYLVVRVLERMLELTRYERFASYVVLSGQKPPSAQLSG